MALVSELLPNGHAWWRIADPAWSNPLDASFAMRLGGRWNPPGSYRTLYFSEDPVTARLNLRRFIERWPYEPQDLRDDTGPILIEASLPRHQAVCDCHTRRGVAAAGLPATYPNSRNGTLVPHAVCQTVGARVKSSRLRGVRARSAVAHDGAGRELAWFPATVASQARLIRRIHFEHWFWG